jgi:RHS repeat-associated protein
LCHHFGEDDTYDGFGNITAETNSAFRGRYAWTGREFETVIGLQYNHDRWYDALAGRWMTQDLLGFSGGDANLYRYVHNASTATTDPSGMDPPIHEDGNGWINNQWTGMMPNPDGPGFGLGSAEWSGIARMTIGLIIISTVVVATAPIGWALGTVAIIGIDQFCTGFTELVTGSIRPSLVNQAGTFVTGSQTGGDLVEAGALVWAGGYGLSGATAGSAASGAGTTSALTAAQRSAVQIAQHIRAVREQISAMVAWQEQHAQNQNYAGAESWAAEIAEAEALLAKLQQELADLGF